MILAVTGGKGGVGKSTIAYNLAAELSALERANNRDSLSNAGSVVVDGDLGMADLPSSHGPDLHDVLADRADPHEAVRETGPVTLVLRADAGRRSKRRLAGPHGRIRRAGADLSLGHRRLAGGDARRRGVTPCCCRRCGTRHDAGGAALADAFRVRALARELEAGLCRVVLNRAGPNPATEAVTDRFGAPAVAVPESEPLATAQAHGQPLRETALDTPARRSLESLADAVYSCSSV